MVNNNNITKIIRKYHNTVNKNKQKNPDKSVDLKGRLKRYILETCRKMSLKRT